MKKRGGRFLLIMGAGLAAMAFIVVYALTSKGIGQSAAAPMPTPIPMKVVAVVNQDVPAYTVLDASNVGTTEVEASTAVTGTTDTPALLYGKMVTQPMSKSQPVMVNQLTDSGFSQVLGKGKKAFTLAVPERATFGGMITEHDYVDVLWTHNYDISQYIVGPDGKPEKENKTLPTTKTILQDVRVLRVISLRPATQSQNSGAQSSGTDATDASSRKTTVQPATATSYAADAGVQAVLILEVNDQQAEVLKFCNENGTLDMSLRSSDGTSKRTDGTDTKGDHDPERTTGITDKVLVEQYGLLLPEILVK
jgi:Flp pilus assembly protein CpaB